MPLSRLQITSGVSQAPERALNPSVVEGDLDTCYLVSFKYELNRGKRPKTVNAQSASRLA